MKQYQKTIRRAIRSESEIRADLDIAMANIAKHEDLIRVGQDARQVEMARRSRNHWLDRAMDLRVELAKLK